MSDTLVLNADGQPYSILPLSTISWQESIKYLILEKVHVLEWYDDWLVSSPSWETRVPAVVMIKKYVKKTSKVRFSKYNVMLRDKFKCQYVVTSCQPCNTSKGNDLLPVPKHEPVEPNYFQLVKNREVLDHQLKHQSWSKFI